MLVLPSLTNLTTSDMVVLVGNTGQGQAYTGYGTAQGTEETPDPDVAGYGYDQAAHDEQPDSRQQKSKGGVRSGGRRDGSKSNFNPPYHQ